MQATAPLSVSGPNQFPEFSSAEGDRGTERESPFWEEESSIEKILIRSKSGTTRSDFIADNRKVRPGVEPESGAFSGEGK